MAEHLFKLLEKVKERSIILLNNYNDLSIDTSKKASVNQRILSINKRLEIILKDMEKLITCK